jgi:predicted nucleic acid-binding Zn ribbon protein
VVEQYKRNPNTECLVCSKPIYKRPGEISQNGKNLFCSQVCFGKNCRKEVPCIVCGKPILAGLHKRTCSRSCSNKNRAGTKYTGRPLKDNVRNIVALRNRLFEIRGKLCERCRYSKSEILQSHHKDRDRNNNNLNNLELVCPNCHYLEHFLSRK